MNKRRHQRIEVQNVVANLSDGVDSLSGTVSNVSRVGMLLADIPNELKNQGKKNSITVTAKDQDIKMLVEPRWVSVNNSEKKMGLEIINAPLDWTVFIMNCGPEDEDLWAATTHLPGF